jgi:hypothetical protein|nr:LamG-like jellyroll fold domain-containing protein [uncultured Flavobacterium sp.]
MKKGVYIVLFLQSILGWAQITLPIQQSNVPKNHLVVNYDFSNTASFSGTGTAVTNLASSSTGTATLSNSPVFMKSLGYVNFDGINQYMTTPNIRSYFKSVNTSVQKSYTMSFWICPMSLNGVVVSELDSQTPNSGWHASNIEIVNGILKYRIWNGTVISSSSTITLNQWYHVAAVYDGTTLKAYLNGVLQGSQINTREIPTTNQYYAIGAAETTNMGSGGNNRFNIATFKIYNIPLNNTDILQEYEREKLKYQYSVHSPNTNANPTYWSVSSAWNSSTGSTGASDAFSAGHFNPWLNSSLGWAAQQNNTSQFITLNYDEPITMNGIVTQGRAYNGGQWVSSAHIDVSLDGTNWTRVMSNATLNSNSTEDVKILFPTPVVAKYVKVSPVTWANHITMRLGVIVESKPLISDGLVLRLDAANLKSYPGTGTTWYDLSGNSSNVALTSTTFNAANWGSIGFNGTSSYADFTANIGSTNAVTVEMWVKPISLLGSAGTGAMFFGFNMYDVWTSGGNIGYNTSTGDQYGISSTQANYLGITGGWRHLVFVMNTSSKTNNKIYVNGESQTMSYVSGTFSSANANFNSGAGRISGWRVDTSWKMNMNLANFKVYNRELTQQEITNNFNTDRIRFYADNDGLSPSTASTSAYQIKQDYPSSTDGFYWIKNANINGGAPIKIYADMTTDGGGWTLLMKNSSYVGWDYANSMALNIQIPFTTNAEVISTSSVNYSIIGWADYIKKSSSGFQYMIDAGSRRSFGGIWTANGNYSFLNTDNTQTNVTLNTKFGTWNYVSNNDGIAQRMPWRSTTAGSGTGFLTLSTGIGNWWGTLISNNTYYSPSPWLSDAGGGAANQNPGIIWYWVR